MHDLLQELKTHPRIRRILDGGERLQWGAKTIPEGGFVALPKRFHAPGLLLAGDGVGLVNVPALKGIHYAIESGRLAAEAAWRTLERGASPRTALATYDDVAARVVHLERPARGAQHASGVRARLLRRRRARGCDDRDEGKVSAWRRADRARCGPAADQDRPRAVVSGARREARRSTSSRASSPRATARATTSRTTFASRRRSRASSRRCGSKCARRRSTRSAKPTATAPSRCKLAPSNCVQCGAITAKGGRLTPPEGGSGPEYTLTYRSRNPGV